MKGKKAFGKIKEVVEIEVGKNWLDKEEIRRALRRARMQIEIEAQKLGANPFVEFEVVVKPKSPRFGKASTYVWQNAMRYFAPANIPVKETSLVDGIILDKIELGCRE